MKAFARTTSIFFLLLGVLIILIGAGLALSSFAGMKTAVTSSPSIVPNMAGLTILIRIIAGASIGIQGLFITAIGQVLWLLIDISDQTEQTNQHLLAVFRQLYKANS